MDAATTQLHSLATLHMTLLVATSGAAKVPHSTAFALSFRPPNSVPEVLRDCLPRKGSFAALTKSPHLTLWDSYGHSLAPNPWVVGRKPPSGARVRRPRRGADPRHATGSIRSITAGVAARENHLHASARAHAVAARRHQRKRRAVHRTTLLECPPLRLQPVESNPGWLHRSVGRFRLVVGNTRAALTTDAGVVAKRSRFAHSWSSMLRATSTPSQRAPPRRFLLA
jgi:hypothetical protein